MSYKTDLQGNNTDLQKILDMILALGLVDKTIPVTITGTGNTTYCYVIINDTIYVDATSGIEVSAGDVITFYVKGNAVANKTVKIDEVFVIDGTDGAIEGTYEWTIPDGITNIAIAMTYIYNPRSVASHIVVTTT